MKITKFTAGFLCCLGLSAFIFAGCSIGSEYDKSMFFTDEEQSEWKTVETYPELDGLTLTTEKEKYKAGKFVINYTIENSSGIDLQDADFFHMEKLVNSERKYVPFAYPHGANAAGPLGPPKPSFYNGTAREDTLDLFEREHFVKLLPKGEYRLVSKYYIFEEYLEYGSEAQIYAAYGYFKIK